MAVTEFFILMLLYSGAGFQLAVPPLPEDPILLQLAPNDCLFYSNWSGIAAPDPSSGNRTEMLLAEPEIRQAAKGLRTEFEKMFQVFAGAPQEFQLISDLVKEWTPYLVTRPGCMFVNKMQADDRNPIEMCLILNLGDKLQDAQAELAKISSAFPEEIQKRRIVGNEFFEVYPSRNGPKLSWGIRGNHLIAGIGDSSIQGVLLNSKSGAPKWATDAKAKLPVDRLATLSYFNVSKLMKLFSQMNNVSGDRGIKALELDKFESIVAVTGLDQNGFVSKSRLNCSDQLPRILKPIATNSLSSSAFRHIPSDANFVIGGTLHTEKLFETIFQFMEQFDPAGMNQFRVGIGQINQMLDGDIQKDLTNSLGEVWTLHNSPSEGGPLFMGTTLSLEIKDRKRFQPLFDRCMAGIKSLDAIRVNGKPVLISELSYYDQTIFQANIDNVPISPAWCLLDDRVLLSWNSQNIRSTLRRDSNFQSFAQNKTLQARLKSSQNAIAMGYFDSKNIIETVYPFAPFLLELMSSEIGEPIPKIDSSMLPSLASITQHLQYSMTLVEIDGHSIVTTTNQTLPASNWSTVLPLSLAFSLPAMQASSAASKRANAINRMKQISLAMLNFESAHQRLPAASIRTKDGKPGLSWRVQILPYIDEQALYNEFHWDEPWDSAHNKKLINRMPQIYRSPTSNAGPGLTNYLAVRGKNSVIVDQKQGVRLRDIRDGLSKTVLHLEVDDSHAVIWTKPDDFEWNEDNPLEGLGGQHPGQMFVVGFADGAVRVFSRDLVDKKILKAMFTRNGGEVVAIP